METKNLSDWLVVSDIDGTLNNKLRQLPKINREAINRFVLECNGNFTLASGRNVQSMRKHYENLPIAGTPAVILNGAGVYDYNHEKMLHFDAINDHAMDLVFELYKRFPLLEIEILTDKMIYTLNSRIFARVMVRADKLHYINCKHPEEIPRENWGKVIFLGMPDLIKRLRKYVDTLTDTRANFMSSSISSFEMLNEGVHKGTGVMKIAELYGIKRSHIAAIGDYFNDYDMLKTVGLPACCGQAPKAMHEIAKFQACHCNKGAVADLLEYIMNDCKEEEYERRIKTQP